MTKKALAASLAWLALLAAGCPAPAQPATSNTTTVGTTGASYAAGDRVIARFNNGPFWFAARVDAVSGDAVTVAFLDGDAATLPSTDVRPFTWGPGTAVECNWRRGGKFFPGRITTLTGDTAHIAYDDGDQEDTSVAYCRTR